MWNDRFIKIKNKFLTTGAFLWSNVVFIAILYIYVTRALLNRLLRLRILGFIPRLMHLEILVKFLDKMMKAIDFDVKNQVSRGYLVELAFRNMKSKKNRTVVTIGGVALGVGAIVFLVSMGYGLERMVISKVARLDELKMADVSSGKAASLLMNDEIINRIKGLDGVSEVIPMVSMVSKMRYNNSVLDVMTYGVDERYLKAVDAKLLNGEPFKNKDGDVVSMVPIDYSGEGEVAGIKQEVVWVQKGEKVEDGVIRFNVAEGKKVLVYENCETDSVAAGEVIRSEGGYIGEEVWGEVYSEADSAIVGKDVYQDETYSKWVRTKVPLWKVDDKGVAIPYLDGVGKQKWTIGCIKSEDLVIDLKSIEEFNADNLDEYIFGLENKILGETTASASASRTASESAELAAVEASSSAELFETVVATDSAGVEWVELRKVGEDKNKLMEIEYTAEPVAEAYVSTGLLKMLGLAPNEALGKKFMVSYIIPDGLIEGKSGRMQSAEKEYKIMGVIEDDNSNFYYFHLADTKGLGVKSYSQLKVVVNDRNKLADVRKAIETIGFKTTSTVDTVAGIERIFATLRLILGFLGTIALAVASLGMFNTMTVSLLERTREVGVMKSMGMLSKEVRELFLAESMIMGMGGGTLGVLFGFVMGWSLSITLSAVSVLKGQGVINISYVPWFFVAFIMFISFMVGMVTGWYPSKRARMISALNALRYE